MGETFHQIGATVEFGAEGQIGLELARFEIE